MQNYHGVGDVRSKQKTKQEPKPQSEYCFLKGSKIHKIEMQPQGQPPKSPVISRVKKLHRYIYIGVLTWYTHEFSAIYFGAFSPCHSIEITIGFWGAHRYVVF